MATKVNAMAAETSSVLQAEDILKLLKEREVLDTYDLSLEFSTDHQQIVGTIKSLSSLGDVRMICTFMYMCMYLYVNMCLL